MPPWRGWYHVTTSTYGTWLPGDPRGWRERGHRAHVPGDYRRPPPPGFGGEVLRRSKRLLQQPPVRLDAPQREEAGRALVEHLVDLGAELLVLSLDSTHMHLLGRFAESAVRPLLGKAKKHAYFRLRDAGWAERLWAEGSRVEPIKERSHQVRVFHYIVRHKEHGAWVWTFREGLFWRQGEG